MNTIIWIIQAILSLTFVMAGSLKLFMPKDMLGEEFGKWVYDFKNSQLKLIGFLEILGALGLIFPMEFKLMPILTPMAACCLVFTMMGAVHAHLKRKESIIKNIVLILLAAFVFIGRFYVMPVVYW